MHAPRILIVGGNARGAHAFRRYRTRTEGAPCVVLTRRSGNAQSNETVVPVASYFEPVPALLAGVDVVVNFVGVTKGSDETMRAINADGPVRLAEIARNAGVRQFVHL